MKHLKKILSVFLCVLIVFSMCVVMTFAENEPASHSDTDPEELALIYDEKNYEHDFEPGKVLVTLNQDVSLVSEADRLTDESIKSLYDISDELLETVVRKLIPDVQFEGVKNMSKLNVDDMRGLEPVERDRIILILTLESNTKQSVIEAIDTLKRNHNVAYSAPNYIYKLENVSEEQSINEEWINSDDLRSMDEIDYPVNDPSYYEQFYLTQIEADLAWEYETGSHDVMVGVMDSGIDYEHEDLADNIALDFGYNALIDERVDADLSNAYIVDDDNGHGTHVAGIIGAVGNNEVGITGVCQEVSIVPIKFAYSMGHGNIAYTDTTYIIDAFTYATSINIPIVNCSYRMFYDFYDPDIYEAFMDYDGLIVGSAGNDSLDLNYYTNSMYPCDNIMLVGACTDFDYPCYFSNYGTSTVDLFAPGDDIYSTYPNWNDYVEDQYVEMDGTSMAAPMAAGTAALLLSYNQNLTTSQLKAAILAGVDTVNNLPCITEGRLNVYNSLMYVKQTTDPIISAEFAVSTIPVNTPVQITIVTRRDCRLIRIENENHMIMGKTLISKTYDSATETRTWVYSMTIGTPGLNRTFTIIPGSGYTIDTLDYRKTATASIDVTPAQ